MTASCPQCGAVWTVGVDRPVSAVYCSPACRKRAWHTRRAHSGGVWACASGTGGTASGAGAVRLSLPGEAVGSCEVTGFQGELTAREGVVPGARGGDVRMTGMVGSVTRQRYDELVRLGRDWVETMSSVQWQLGDAGLEIEPMRSYGGANPTGSEELFTVSKAIRMFAEDVGPAYSTVRDYRWVASRWPKERRRTGVSHTIHKILASIPNEQERFEAVDNPPPNPRGGPARWTHDSAKRIVGWKVDTPESVQEKVDAIHDLAADDQVAARVATDFLRRPAVASKAMADDYPDYRRAA
ncbi:DUF6192 family protein [Streptomyces mirabilis]|uniref:DUF6192 family protein n=1 Tax=Streptomyces mirabilis TaxID=68239 RepID=UPI0034335738